MSDTSTFPSFKNTLSNDYRIIKNNQGSAAVSSSPTNSGSLIKTVISVLSQNGSLLPSLSGSPSQSDSGVLPQSASFSTSLSGNGFLSFWASKWKRLPFSA